MKKILDLTDISDECKLSLLQSENSWRNARKKSKTREETKKRSLRRRSKKKCNKNTTKGHTEAGNTKENKDRDIGDKYFHLSTVTYPGISDDSENFCLSLCIQTINRTCYFPMEEVLHLMLVQ